jgi:hypothetical protein
MNQKQSKLMKKWCEMVWNGSSPEDRSDFASLDAFVNKVKKDTKDKPNLMKFIKQQMELPQQG